MILHVPAEDKKANQPSYLHAQPNLDLHGIQPKNANGLAISPQYTDI